MQSKKVLHTALFLGAIGLSIFVFLFIVAASWIGYDVRRQCRDAEYEYGKVDCVEALITLLHDKHRGYRARNSAIWALGQLGDTRALPELKKYYTGNIPDRESLDAGISQYELKKAINLTSGGVNVTAIFWR